jgi:hypothetical protein
LIFGQDQRRARFDHPVFLPLFVTFGHGPDKVALGGDESWDRVEVALYEFACALFSFARRDEEVHGVERKAEQITQTALAVALLAVLDRHQNFHRMSARRDPVWRKEVRILPDLANQRRAIEDDGFGESDLFFGFFVID